MNTSKISSLLEDKYLSIESDLWDKIRPKDWGPDFQRSMEEAWCGYLNGLDLTILTHEDIRYDFESIVNHSAQGRVCVSIERPSNNENDAAFVLIPKELAERILILGYLPEKI